MEDDIAGKRLFRISVHVNSSNVYKESHDAAHKLVECKERLETNMYKIMYSQLVIIAK